MYLATTVVATQWVREVDHTVDLRAEIIVAAAARGATSGDGARSPNPERFFGSGAQPDVFAGFVTPVQA